MIMKDSIEERMITLQDAKSSLGNGSLRKLTAEERKRARITALKGELAIWEHSLKQSLLFGICNLFTGGLCADNNINLRCFN